VQPAGAEISEYKFAWFPTCVTSNKKDDSGDFISYTVWLESYKVTEEYSAGVDYDTLDGIYNYWRLVSKELLDK
jgi:hypothetical protein